ncbi:RING/FYVE/PHD zinc finger superfamily protein [Raphanus sativus]|uniref:Probable E3 ubiquitin ligase SUD1 n=1 Tax=Raphanus sativus TaxID=3726 RepID=A0A6J0NU43_RAPSA|nr:probable E3 ubiquitin ligase SUD1 [Raphanus sativus]KAJ4893048.1 RING/FYVE/PHD zinc finger superfamily protein [Raphanus sativus]
MDDSPEVDESFSAEDDDEDLCRICRSPEEPGNPLRYPCSCRGSIKFVHGDCLRTWLNRRGGNNKCELCGRSYSFVPVYSENAPERLPCDEFLIGVLLRVAHYLKLLLLWIPVILFNTLCISLHPSCQVFVADAQTVLMSRKLAYLWVNFLCSSCVAFSILIISFIRIDVEDFRVGGLPGWFLPEGGGLVAGVLHFLWKYMKILCDWYYLKLIQFLGQPHRVILVPPVTLLDEFGGFRRLLFFFDDHVFAGLAISVFCCTLFVLLPFSVGWVVIATVGGSYLSGKSPVLLGYIILQSSYFAYFGILFILHQSSLPVIVRCLALGVHFITVTVTLPCRLLAFLVKACKNILLNKDAFVLFLKFGALPWIVGWFLDICTSPMFGTRSFQIYEIFFWMMSFRWLSGVCYLVTAAIMQIQEIMHKRAFWYLLDVTDPNYKITKLNLRHMFFALASHGVLLVIMFHLPIKSITLVSPSFFPLELWVSDESCFSGAASAIYFSLMHAGSGWLIVITKPAMELIVHKWIITVSSWLQLSDFLLVVPRGEGMMQPRRPYDDNGLLLYSLAEGSMVTICKSHNAENDVKEQRHNRYRTRIAIMLMLAALSLFLVSTAFMSLPILVGRVFSYSISFILLRYGVKHDDLCAFWIGYYILRAIYISLCFAFDHILTGRTDFLVKYILLRIRNALLFSIWISIIPGLLGLLIDLMIIIPLRVPLNESPIYFLIQDWLIGVVVLHLWTFLTMLTPIKCFATKAWRRKLERIKSVEINSLPSMWLLRDVIGSIINTLLTTLAIPYVLVKSLLPLLGYSQSVNAATERFIWPVSLALIAVWFMTKLTFELIIYLHKSIFNERYMVGERVGDLTEDL